MAIHSDATRIKVIRVVFARHYVPSLLSIEVGLSPLIALVPDGNESQ